MGRLTDGLAALHTAHAHLAHMRLYVTTAGAAFGHELSYLVARMLQPVGRDLAMLLLRARGVQAAILLAEKSLLARAMGDWMSRNHGVRAVPQPFVGPTATLSGSINASEPATLQEIAECASRHGPLLYLVALPDGHVGWLVRRDGGVTCERLPAMADALTACRALIPTLGGRGGLRHLGRDRCPRANRVARDRLLGQLHDALLTPALCKALADQGERLVIIADTDFSAVPWAAMRSGAGRYLVQDYQIEQWPSVTARLIIEGGARLHTWQRGRRAGPVAPLVMGVGDFSHLEITIDEQPIVLQGLPGAEGEASDVATRLRARAYLNRDATIERLFNEGQGAEIVHLASHGLIDSERPEGSLMVFGNGCISAGQLYKFDPGLRCGLVVLSACQTGLGRRHPDSLIGLANAFLIAGAQAVVATLWKVPDDATRTLMDDFYQGLADGLSAAAALRHAQQQALESPTRADPFCWAAPVLTGMGDACFALTPKAWETMGAPSNE